MGKKGVKIGDSLDDLFSEGSSEYQMKMDKINQAGIEDTNQSANLLRPCPPAIKKIRITAKAFDDLILMSKAVNEVAIMKWGENSPKMEVFCYILTDQSLILENEPAVISEIYIPHHTASETSVEVTEKSVMEVQNYIRKHSKICLGWAHSHGRFEVFSSQIDEENHLKLLMDTLNIVKIPPFDLKYSYGITVNDKKERFGVILTQYNCGHIQREEDEKFQIIGKSYNHSEKKVRMEQIVDEILERVEIEKPSGDQSREEINKEIVQAFINEFIHKIRRAQNILFDSISDEDDRYFKAITMAVQKFSNLSVNCAEESYTEILDRLLSSLQQKEESI